MNRDPGVILPNDEHNARLISNVHPVDWINPEPHSRYHLVVVGAGTAGLVTAAGAAGLGARVALVESHLMGGDCLNVGCVPSKGMISAARAWQQNPSHIDTGAGGIGGDRNFAAAMSRMRRIRAAISPNDSAARFAELGVDVFFGRGRFSSADTIEVDGKRLRFRRAVIATGARAQAPPIAGLSSVDYLTNETVFELTTLPHRLAVIGAGPIGCELAQAFRRFGSEVTILDSGSQVLPREDPDAAAIVAAALAREGVRYLPEIAISKVERIPDGSSRISYEDHAEGGAVECDKILVAVGRRPNVEDLNLDAVGVTTNEGGVVVDNNMRTANRKVFACGDVASEYKFTHAADAQARIVIQNALFFGRARADKLIMPWCTYTSPEIAHVGLYERDASAAGIEIDTLTIPMSEVDRALLEGQSEGFLRVHTKKGSDKLVGATLVAEHAGDMIGELALAITAGIGLGKIAATIHPYPTQGEVVKKAADAWRRTKLTPKVKCLFASYFKMMR
jgi:pyruvate/2-oxoglutarate dehydrogenase complex dihydrolipoamide dehydrogenase (E3) component